MKMHASLSLLLMSITVLPLASCEWSDFGDRAMERDDERPVQPSQSRSSRVESDRSGRLNTEGRLLFEQGRIKEASDKWPRPSRATPITWMPWGI